MCRERGLSLQQKVASLFNGIVELSRTLNRRQAAQLIMKLLILPRKAKVVDLTAKCNESYAMAAPMAVSNSTMASERIIRDEMKPT